MAQKVFYSWQSDRPNATNRSFILTALRGACAELSEDSTIDERPEVDHDTQNVPGSPDIVETIFAKIDGADVFIADVSLITADAESRACPNPNVLIELGYAIKTVGWNSIILVMNAAFGGPELLPFDLRTKRVMTYHMAMEATERATERKRLQGGIQAGLRIIFEHSQAPMPGTKIEPAFPGELARHAVEGGKPNASSLVRRFMQWFGEQLDGMAPDWNVTPRDEALVQALERTVVLLVDFANLAEVIAAHDAAEPARALFSGFEHVLARYDIRSGFSGTSYDTDFDFAKFVGHEALVMFVAYLIREERWAMIADVLGGELIVTNARGTHRREFGRLSEHLKLLEQRNQRMALNRVSLHADLLKERHEHGELSKLISFSEFMEAELLLWIRGELTRAAGGLSSYWYPRSVVYMGSAEPPRYLLRLNRGDLAAAVAPAFGAATVAELRDGIGAAQVAMRELLRRASSFQDGPLHDFDATSIGTA